VNAATRVFSRDFDADFLKLPAGLQTRIQAKIDELGASLDCHPHVRLNGLSCYRLRVGDYRIVYDFDATKGVL